MYIGTYLQEQSIKYEYCHQITSQATKFKGQGHLKKDKSYDLFLALNLITGNSDRPYFLFMGQQARRNLWEQQAFVASYLFHAKNWILLLFYVLKFKKKAKLFKGQGGHYSRGDIFRVIRYAINTIPRHCVGFIWQHFQGNETKQWKQNLICFIFIYFGIL